MTNIRNIKLDTKTHKKKITHLQLKIENPFELKGKRKQRKRPKMKTKKKKKKK